MDKATNRISPKDRLSCKLCQRRKVGCDKADPCATCRRSGVKCEYAIRQKLPRGRNGGRKRADAELKERIGRLEAMMTTWGSSPNTKRDTRGDSPANPASEARSSPSETSSDRDLTRYLGSSFWDSLSNEVSGLRDVLDEESDSEIDSPESLQSQEAEVTKSTCFNFLLCGPDSFMMAPGAIQQPPQPIIDKLLTLYFNNVDPIFKIVHAPSVRDYIQGGKPYLGHARGDPAVTALTFAIYYAAVVTIDDETCRAELGDERTTLCRRYRFATEASLAQADFINSQDITALQALVMMLPTARADDNSRWSWTVLALAARIAYALGLQKESTSPTISLFDMEMRRRLWHCLRTLDAHAANDRASDPVIPDPEYNTRLPANINDVDISPDSVQPIVEREGITEMTLCLMLQSSTKHFWRLCFVPHANMQRAPLPIEHDWSLRQREIDTWCQTLEEKYLRYCDENIIFHWFVKRLGENMGQLARLIAIRPMQRHPAAKPPHVNSGVILKLAIDLLVGARRIYTHMEARRWGWYIWVQWHPLAVALAELCTYTEGPLVEEAWQAVESTYERYIHLVADSRRGMLWRPIEKLYKKAKANRAAKLATGDDGKITYSQPGSQAHKTQPTPGNFNPNHIEMGQFPAQPDQMVDLQQLSVNGTPPVWNPVMPEPVDMAWLDWATFAEDVTDFNMFDSVNQTQMPWQ